MVYGRPDCEFLIALSDLRLLKLTLSNTSFPKVALIARSEQVPVSARACSLFDSVKFPGDMQP